MGDVRAGSQGWVLRQWRTRSGLTEEQLGARAGGIRAQAVSSWESNDRVPLRRHLEIDRALEADGVCAQMLWAATSRDALPRRELWRRNLAAPDPWGGDEIAIAEAIARPAWIWIRAADVAARTSVEVRWGPVAVPLARHIDDRGVLVTSPVAVANPAVEVEFLGGQVGWVDFGTGVIPEGVDIPRVSGVKEFTFGMSKSSRSADAALFLVSQLLQAVNSSQPDLAAAFAKSLGNDVLIRHVLMLASAADSGEDLTSREDDLSEYEPSGETFRSMLDGRRLDIPKTADLIVQATGDSAAREEIERGLAGLARGRRSKGSLLAKVDLVFGADGLTCFDQITPETHADLAIVTFPDWWVGPITLQVRQSAGVERLRLVWGPWAKPLVLRPGQYITCDRSMRKSPPLRVEFQKTEGLAVGRYPTLRAWLGKHPGAIDVNENWEPSGPSAKRPLQEAGLKIYLHALGLATERQLSAWFAR
jgi:transcriptional regulator with XRE-family HTH domain